MFDGYPTIQSKGKESEKEPKGVRCERKMVLVLNATNRKNRHCEIILKHDVPCSGELTLWSNVLSSSAGRIIDGIKISHMRGLLFGGSIWKGCVKEARC